MKYEHVINLNMYYINHIDFVSIFLIDLLSSTLSSDNMFHMCYKFKKNTKIKFI